MEAEIIATTTDSSPASTPAAGPRLSIIIPAYNEELGIGPVLEGLRHSGFEFLQEIIVVDDGSHDKTAEIARAAGATVLRHRHNQGYGAALKTGIRVAQGDFVLVMDADGQHSAGDVLRLWQAAGQSDMVVGARTARLHSPAWRMPGKWLLGRLANYLTGRNIPDLNSGFRIMRRATVLKYMHLCPAGFSFTTTITMALLSRGYSVDYLPITVQPRVGKSTVTVKTGLDTLILILRISALFNPLQVFIPASLLIGAIGILWAIPYALLGHGISTGSMLAIVTAVLLFGVGLTCDQISQLRLERFE